MANDSRKILARGKKTPLPNKKIPNQYSKMLCRIVLKMNLPKKTIALRGKILLNYSKTASSFIITVNQYEKILSIDSKTLLLSI